MPFVDDPNSEESNSVAGSTPLQQGAQPTSSVGDGSTGPNQASGSAVMTSSPQSQPSTNKKKSASSGMFTNIQNYVNKNKPQAKKMAGAVTQDFSKQAGEIRAAAESKKTEQSTLIGANTDKVNAEKDWAQGQVDQVMGTSNPTSTEPIQYNPSQADTDRFSAVAGGDTSSLGLSNVGDINLAEQKNRMSALGQLAKGASTEQGRRNLLGETFKKQGEYNRGMSGLDNLITSGDRQARESLISGTQNASDDLNSRIQTISTESRDAKLGQDQLISGLSGDIKGIASGAESGIQTGISSDYDAAIAKRKALLDPNSAEYKAAVGGAQSKIDKLGSAVGSRSDYADYLQNLAQGSNYRSGGGSSLNQYFDNMRLLDSTGELQVPTGEYTTSGNNSIGGGGITKTPIMKTISGDEANDYMNQGGGLSGTHYQERLTLENIMKQANNDLLGQDSDSLYGLQGANTTYTNENNQARRNDLGGSYDFFKNQLSGMGSADDVISRKIAELGGTDYEGFAQGSDIGKYDTASQDQINRINALKGFMGNTDTITEDQLGDRSFTSAEDLKSLMAKYGAVK